MTHPLTNDCYRACYHEGDVARVMALLDDGVDINARAPCSGSAPLDAAIWGGHENLVRALVERGADVEGVGYGEFTALMAAANQGLPGVLTLLLTAGAQPSLPSPVSGETPLHTAASKGFHEHATECVRCLLAHGADPNTRTVIGAEAQTYIGGSVRLVGETPLHLAAAFGDGEMIMRLVDAGADVHATDAHGLTAFNWYGRHQRDTPHIRVGRDGKPWTLLQEPR